jgi:hypothetical protein
MKQSHRLLFFALILTTAGFAQQPTSRVNITVDSTDQILSVLVRNLSVATARISLLNSDGQTCAVHKFEAAHRQKLNIVCRDLTDGHYTMVIKTPHLLVRRGVYVAKGKVRLNNEQFFSGKEMLVGK